MWRIALIWFLASSVGVSTSGQCPTWLTEYEAFHTSARGRPGTRYLVHSVVGAGGGIGDRLHGALFTLRAAAPLRRVVLFTWANPIPLTEFVEPPGLIDWRLDGTAYNGSGKVLRFMDFHGPDAPPEVRNGSLVHVDDQFLTFQVRGCRKQAAPAQPCSRPGCTAAHCSCEACSADCAHCALIMQVLQVLPWRTTTCT